MTNIVQSVDLIPISSIVRVQVDWLVLDRRNPRLTTITDGASDEEIITQLFNSEHLAELIQSIAANGYLDIEPLIVLEENGALVVLEGNRRLAALRLFREPDLAVRISDQQRVRITLPDIPDHLRSTLEHVSVYRVAAREDARSFIGFKHINGAAKWESYAKAKFAADWYRRGGIDLSDIASCIGDRHDTVKRMVNAIYVLEQAQSTGKFAIDDRVNPRFNFSHLYTALSRAPYMEFLGLDRTWSRYDPSPDPVPNNKLDRLAEVLRWIYGSKEDGLQPVVISQNPHIKELGEVLSNTEALIVLQATGSLDEAHSSTKPADRKFSEALLRARREIRNASDNLRGFDNRDVALIGIAEDVSETAQTILDRMRRRVRDAQMEDE